MEEMFSSLDYHDLINSGNVSSHWKTIIISHQFIWIQFLGRKVSIVIFFFIYYFHNMTIFIIPEKKLLRMELIGDSSQTEAS